MKRTNLDAKRIATTLVGLVGGYFVASLVGFVIGMKHPFAVHWTTLSVGLATFLFLSFVLGNFSKSVDSR